MRAARSGHRRCWLFTAMAAAGVLLGSCDLEEARLETYAEQASGASGRNITAARMAESWREGRLTLDAAVDHAHDLLDRRHPSEAAIPFAGSVLDFAAMIEGELPRDQVQTELLMRRIGRLAFRAAERAAADNRIEAARSLVLAGPQAWQREPYWLRYPDHDALAAAVLAASGEKDEALRRLRSRPVLEGPAEEAYRLLTGAP